MVIHDPKTQKIVHISGQLSKRRVGDDSLIDFSALKDTYSFSKINFDGRLIKSISVGLKEHGELLGLMCINCDISVFESMQVLSATMNHFKLEEYFWQHEFSAQYLLCSSDAESLSLKEVLDMASSEEKSLWADLRRRLQMFTQKPCPWG